MLRLGKHSGRGKKSGAKTECLPNEGTAVTHNYPYFEMVIRQWCDVQTGTSRVAKKSRKKMGLDTEG
jgi:hypothetical protein